MRVDSDILPATDIESLSVDLAEAVLRRIAPSEIPRLRAAARRHFAGPSRRPDRRTAFAADDTRLTPYVLTAAVPVVQYLAAALAAHYARRTGEIVAGRVRGIIRGTEMGSGEAVLTARQIGQVRHLTRRHAMSAGGTEDLATALSDAVAESLADPRPAERGPTPPDP
ncbi:hypothetical protein Val02_09450 [Virgisporangium aliadipatigenens]|uniref:Uncharacterized protein n=1 Tax=Virgisporangium aliadipatigenens TaxID=741659 RepID=A0A8J3YF82_9ACTN|nr:hypothetical protein [Virgisporangium aliadipatigenens]GIJ44059.1 hypothetical protein Val02_09450 [Virgisporangium aliadipatigenens]